MSIFVDFDFITGRRNRDVFFITEKINFTLKQSFFCIIYRTNSCFAIPINTSGLGVGRFLNNIKTVTDYIYLYKYI